MRLYISSLIVLFALVFPLISEGASAKIPDWAEAAIREKGSYDRFEGENHGMVLLRDEVQNYDGKGGVAKRFRSVVHIGSRDERDWGQAVVSLQGPEVKLQQFNAWILYPSGKVESFVKRELFEMAAELDALYSESKMMILDRAASMRDDTVFIYEYETQAKQSFMESFWLFQNSLPTVRSRFELIAPESWEVNGVVLNGEGVVHHQRGGSHVWEARDLECIKEEDSRPSLFATSTMLGVSLRASEKDTKRFGLISFGSWNELARYAFEAQREAEEPNASIREKAEELTWGAVDDWERIRAICEYAQSVNYVAVSMNLSKGGGYKPRPATFVFEKHYGDCKDMTVLARSLLKALGVESYSVVASVGDEEYVHDDWASPAQFNHCILAVKAPDGLESSAVVEHAQLGRLLIFDPTQKFTPVGFLPDSLQGTKVLVGSELTTGLTELPLDSSDVNRSVRTATVALTGNGTMGGAIHEESFGLIANYMRMLSRSLSPEDLTKRLEAWISAGTRDAKIVKLTTSDDIEGNRFTLDIEFSAPFYARRIGESKLVFSPIFLSRREWVPPIGKERTTDFMFGAWSLQESIQFELPEGFALESVREAYGAEEDFCAYTLESSRLETGLNVRRSITSRYMRVPKSDYSKIVGFFEQLTRMESAPVVVGK